MLTSEIATNRVSQALGRLTQLSVNDYYNPYKEFEWVDALPEEQYWMSRDLMSVYGTPLAEQLSETQLMALSRWESINFYSLNVHGIRELLTEVIKRIHTPGFEIPSEFFHHVLGEENEHMWLFSQFCLRYGKLYKDKKLTSDGFPEPDIQSFMVFTRILIFEEIVDYYNSRMAKDESLHPMIQRLNLIHHHDESRHIAGGREVVSFLYSQLRGKYSVAKLMEIEDYIRRYLVASIQSLYNPNVYRDAGIPDSYQFRVQLLQDPARKLYHDKLLKRTMTFLVKQGILSKDELSV